jgi:hypothetical protein
MGTLCADGRRMRSILQQTYPGNSSAILTRLDNCFVLDRARRETEERLRPRARDVMVMMNRQGKRKYRDANNTLAQETFCYVTAASDDKKQNASIFWIPFQCGTVGARAVYRFPLFRVSLATDSRP